MAHSRYSKRSRQPSSNLNRANDPANSPAAPLVGVTSVTLDPITGVSLVTFDRPVILRPGLLAGSKTGWGYRIRNDGSFERVQIDMDTVDEFTIEMDWAGADWGSVVAIVHSADMEMPSQNWADSSIPDSPTIRGLDGALFNAIVQINA